MEQKKRDLLLSIQLEAANLKYGDGKLNAVLTRIKMIVKNVFGTSTNYLSDINLIRFTPRVTYSGISESVYKTQFENGKNKLENLISVMIEDYNLSLELASATHSEPKNDFLNSKIFIVHGHNEEMKQSVARFVEKIKFNAVILHEQANEGKTIIEKFKNHSDVAFAIILLSPDDLAIKKDGDLSSGKLRARQNVIFEMGFFIGKLGSERVIALHQLDDNFEIPSDYQGVIYTPYDHTGNWKYQILKELKAAGASVDANDVLY